MPGWAWTSSAAAAGFIGFLLIYMGIVHAATANPVPVSDVTTGWATSSGTVHYSLVNDANTTADTCDSTCQASYVHTGTGSTSSVTDKYNLTQIPNVASASQLVVKVYAKQAVDGRGGTDDTLTITVNDSNSATSATATVTPTSAYAWYTVTFSGSWVQADVNSMSVTLANTVVGSGPGSQRENDMSVAGVYGSLTYVSGVSFGQTAYRLYDNQDSSAPVTFAKAWGGTDTDYGQSLVQTSDGGYAVTGQTSSYGAGLADMFLAKYDSTGTLSWSRTWGGTNTDYGQSLVQTSDGGYAVTGYTYSYGAGSNDMFLAKYDSTGTLSWSRTWGGTNTDYGQSLVQTSDGGYAVTGYTASYGAGSQDMFLAKYDSTGTLSWSRTWGGTNTDYGQSLVQTSDGGYAVTGYTYSYGAGSNDMFLAKYDSSGTLSWSRTWGGTNTDYGQSLVQTSDGGYAVTGYTASYGAGSQDMFLAKYDSTGTLSWSRTWGGTNTDYGQSLVQASDGGYAVTGYTASYGAGSSDMFLARYDSSGTLAWSKTWGGTGGDNSNSLVQTSDGGYAVTGYTDSYGAGSGDMLLAKYDSSGTIAGCSTTTCKADGTDYTSSTSSPAATTSSPAGTTSSPAGTTSSPAATTSSPAGTSTVVVAVNPTGIGVGSALAGENSAATITGDGTAFRLRLDIAVSTAQLDAGAGSFKLQYALRGSDNSCDANFTGETFSDVTDNTTVRYYNNPNAVSGLGLASATSPADNGRTLVGQSYQEKGTAAFTNPAAVPNGQDGMWDFALTTYHTLGGQHYCLRVVKSDGTVLTNGYTTYTGASAVAEVIMPAASYNQAGYRWYDNGATVTFAKTWGGTGADIGFSLVQTSDGGYAVTGQTSSYGAGFGDMFLAKYDSAGTLAWSKTWGGTGADFGYSLVQTSDGGYAVTGNTTSYGAGSNDMFLAKYDSTGTLAWSKTWGGTGADYGRSLVQTSDGGYAVTGYTTSYGDTTNGDMFLAKYDSTGTLSWSRTWGGTGIDQGQSLVQTSDGGYAVTGYTASYGAGSYDMFLAKYDSSGTLSWSKTWGGTGSDTGQSLVQTSDGGYAITGYTTSYGAGSNDMFLTKYDASGTLAWSKTWGGTGADYGQSLVQTSDGGYAVTGQTASYGDTTNGDVFLAKYDSTGTLSWSRTWGGTGADYGQSLVQTSDGGYAVTGQTASYGAGGNDTFLAKYDSTGTMSGCGTICSSPTASTSSPTAGTSSPAAGTSSPAATTSSPAVTTSSPDAFSGQVVKTGGATFTFAKAWGGTNTDYGYSLVQTSDGGYAVTGYTASYGAGSSDMFLAKYDSSGTLAWSKTWGGTGDEWGYSLVQTSDGGYAITGYTTSYGAGSDMFLAKYDSSGTLSWSRTWGGSGDDYGQSLVQTSDGGYAVTGYTASYGAGSSDMFLAKYDSSGTLSWSRTWGGTNTDYGYSLVQTSDGGYAVTGQTYSYGAGSGDMLLAKYDSSGTIAGCSTTTCKADGTDYTSSISSPAATTTSPSPTTSSPAATTSSPAAGVNADGTGYNSSRTTVVAVVSVGSAAAGSVLAAGNSLAYVPALGTPFRLRLLVNVSNSGVGVAGQSFKLQYATRAGSSCASASYADVSGSTAIRWYDNTNVGDGVKPDTSGNDPTDGTNTVVAERYVESNNFSNSGSVLWAGQDGLFDFSLIMPAGGRPGAYCFKVVAASGSPTFGYSQYPQAQYGPLMSQLLRGGKWYNASGKLQPYFTGKY